MGIVILVCGIVIWFVIIKMRKKKDRLIRKNVFRFISIVMIMTLTVPLFSLTMEVEAKEEGTYEEYSIDVSEEALEGIQTIKAGEVKTFTHSEPVIGMVNTWDVDMEIISKNQVQPTDIVMVFDLSLSMEDSMPEGGTKLEVAREATKNFIDIVLSDQNKENTRLAIVGFGDFADYELDFTKDRDKAKNIIDSFDSNTIVKYGDERGTATNTQQGIFAASQLLEKQPNNRKKVIVLFTDGVPTANQSLRPANDNLVSEEAVFQHMDYYVFAGRSREDYIYDIGSRHNVILQNSSGKLELTGCFVSNDGDEKSDNHYDVYYDSVVSAVQEANFARQDGYSVIPIGFGFDATSEIYPDGILSAMAGGGQWYNARNGEVLNGAFENVGAAIVSSSVNEGSLSIPMAQGFEIPVDKTENISITQGEFTLSDDGKMISWELGPELKPLLEIDSYATNDGNITYGRLKYRVTINDDILRAEPNGERYNLLGDARFSYLDAEGSKQTVDFPKTYQDPLLISIEKKLVDSSGNLVENGKDTLDRTFTIRITNKDAGTYEDIPLKAGEKKIITSLRLAANYSVNELDDYSYTKDGQVFAGTMGSRDDGHQKVHSSSYIHVVKGEDKEENTFVAMNEREDQSFVITNREKTTGSLTIESKFDIDGDGKAEEDLSEKVRMLPIPYTIKGEKGFKKTVLVDPGSHLVLDDIPFGTYTITQNTADEVEPTSQEPANGKVSMGVSSPNVRAIFTNAVRYAPIDVTNNVGGNMGEKDRDFPHTETDEDGNGVEFTLKDGESENALDRFEAEYPGYVPVLERQYVIIQDGYTSARYSTSSVISSGRSKGDLSNQGAYRTEAMVSNIPVESNYLSEMDVQTPTGITANSIEKRLLGIIGATLLASFCIAVVGKVNLQR